MSSVRSSDRVKREVMRRYDESPEGWQVWVGKDKKGLLDLLISHRKEMENACNRPFSDSTPYQAYTGNLRNFRSCAMMG